MHQREVFDSMPGLHCEAHCFHASAFTPRKKRTEKVSVMWKLWTLCYWRTVQCASSIKQHLIIPNELQNCEHKLFIFSYLDSSRRVDEVNDPRPFCLHRSLFAVPDQCITFGNLWLPAAISSCWISLFWQCLREEHSVRCQVKTICDRFGGEIKRRQTGS